MDALLLLCAAPLAVACGYLLLLTLLSGRVAPPAARPERLRFAVVVPAHDEEAGIGATVKSLLGLAWPRALFQVVVVADNCSDATAVRAEAAGARVLVRFDQQKRGKGYALAHAFETLLAEGKTDAFVVVDADSLASPNLLAAFAARLEAGEKAVQAHYGVSNPDASWRTRLMAIALGMFHIVRSRGRERLGVSCGLRGNGMCFSAPLLREVPHDAFSVVEDLEYGVRLGRAGVRVAYAGEAHVLGEMVSGEKAARSQRRRWEEGRARMARTLLPSVLGEALRKRSGLLLDLALDLAVPPLSFVALGCVLGLAASGAAAFTGHGTLALRAFVACTAALFAYVLRGWAVSGTGARGLLDLGLAPAYVAWKLAVRLSGKKRAQEEWVRTTRENLQP